MMFVTTQLKILEEAKKQVREEDILATKAQKD